MEEFKKRLVSEKSPKRRDSSFILTPINFSVLLCGMTVRVTSQELVVDKTVEVDFLYPPCSKNFQLYPICSLKHHHDNKFHNVCPMPSVTFCWRWWYVCDSKDKNGYLRNVSQNERKVNQALPTIGDYTTAGNSILKRTPTTVELCKYFFLYHLYIDA